MSQLEFKLRDLPWAVRLALTLLLLVNLGGFIASALHMEAHHQNRDERPGLSMTDIQGAYHGVRSEAPLISALEDGHPSEIEGAVELPDAKRQVLMRWLTGERISGDYDNLDLGDAAPAEILAAHCVTCHSRNAKDPVAQTLPLEYWDDVKRVAFSREIAPTDAKILLASTHTHAISLATTTILLVLLVGLTSWTPGMRGALAIAAAVGLFCDLGSWWLARLVPGFSYVIVAGGALFGLATILMTVAILVDLWRPLR